MYVTTTPNYIVFHNCTFKENTAVSTYTFPAKGGALMMSRNSVCRIYGCRFYNNTAVPRTDLGDRPRTLSGLGGAVFVQSANISITSTYFEQNMAFSGQFDGGPSGGALNMEDTADSIVKGCTFINNGAVGFVGSSSYGSSGTGGALYLSFCVAGITGSPSSITGCLLVGPTQARAGLHLSSSTTQAAQPPTPPASPSRTASSTPTTHSPVPATAFRATTRGRVVPWQWWARSPPARC